MATPILFGATFAAPADTERRGDARLAPEASLQRLRRAVLADLNLNRIVAQKHLAVSLVDVTDVDDSRYAGINDSAMMYAASVPKICALVAGFERINEGSLEYRVDVKGMFTRMIRYSSNVDASRVMQKVEYISKVLLGPKYRFYDPAQNGGLWPGKGYGGPSDYWKRDPIRHLSQSETTGANSSERNRRLS